jgi:HEAT repeat protein
LSKDEERRRKELVKQIEKARAERDRLNKEAEDAERLAKAARTAANEGQRAYEALATGLDVEDVSPTQAVAAAPEAPKRNRFITMADEKEAAAAKKTPASAPDPLRIALDLRSAEPEVREKAAFALASLGPDAQPATRALMAALTDANPAVRVAAAQALGRIGTGASAAFAPLTAALTDPDPAVRNAAQAALLNIQSR